MDRGCPIRRKTAYGTAFLRDWGQSPVTIPGTDPKKIYFFVGFGGGWFVYKVKWSERGGASIQDELLIKKIKSGNQQALRLLIERHKQQVFKVTMSVLHDEKAAEDAAQETFIKMVDALPSYQHQGFKTWLSRIAFHKAIDARRKRQRMREDFSSDGQEYHKGQVDSAEEQAMLRERRQRIREQIDQLPDKLQFTVRCYYLEGMSYAEIADRLGLAEKTIEVRLYRARKWMKAHWKEDDF